MDAAKDVLRQYLRGRKISSGIKTFGDAQKYAEGLAGTLAKVLGSDFSEVTEDELADVLRTVLRRAYDDAASMAMTAQYAQNAKLRLQLGALRAEFDAAEVESLAQELAGKAVTGEFVEHLLQKDLIGAIDETIRRNAEARQDMGLEVHIVRTYSDVGLRSGTKYAEDCEWCISRCGEWDNYREAYDAGCFERHPGCLCTIDYTVGTTHSVF